MVKHLLDNATHQLDLVLLYCVVTLVAHLSLKVINLVFVVLCSFNRITQWNHLFFHVLLGVQKAHMLWLQSLLNLDKIVLQFWVVLSDNLLSLLLVLLLYLLPLHVARWLIIVRDWLLYLLLASTCTLVYCKRRIWLLQAGHLNALRVLLLGEGAFRSLDLCSKLFTVLNFLRQGEESGRCRCWNVIRQT